MGERGQRGAFVLHAAALGARSGTATLQIPASFEWNGGRARIENSASAEEAISELDRGITKLEVKLVTLDEVFSQGEHVRVVKLGVEGFELDALKGMEQMLGERRIRYVVFEELRDYPAPTYHFLREMGYSVFGLDHGFLGIKCCRDKGPRVEPISGLPPNYLATYEAEKTVRQLEHGLWKSFGRPVDIFIESVFRIRDEIGERHLNEPAHYYSCCFVCILPSAYPFAAGKLVQEYPP